MSTELEGRKRRKKKNRKNRHHLRRRKFCPKKDGQEYGQVLRILGYLRVLVFCSDDKERVCHIRGRLRSKEYIRAGDFVLVELRHYQNYEGDIILKYTPTEIKLLKKRNKLPVPPETDDRPLLLYGQIANRLGKRRALAFCIDGKRRVCRVLNKERMERGDIILVECRDHLGGESDVIHKCAPDEAQRLKDTNELPGYIKVNNGALLEYGRVIQVLRNCRVLVQCFDGEQRICCIRRKRKRAVISGIRLGHIILVKLRDRKDCRGIVLLKCKPDEAQHLMENNKLSGIRPTTEQKEENTELKELEIKSGNNEGMKADNNISSDGNRKRKEVGGEKAGNGSDIDLKMRSGINEEEQSSNIVPSGGSCESEEKKGETVAVGSGSEQIIRYGNSEEEQASNIVPSGGNSECEEKDGETALAGSDTMNILLENDKKKAEASSPESPIATTSKKMSSLNEDIMEQLLKNQILKHELSLKKCRLADLQIEYITRQLRRGFQE